MTSAAEEKMPKEIGEGDSRSKDIRGEAKVESGKKSWARRGKGAERKGGKNGPQQR